MKPHEMRIYHAHCSIPEQVTVEEWLARHDLAEWGNPKRGYREHRPEVARFFGLEPGTLDISITLLETNELLAERRLDRAVGEIGGRVTYPPEVAVSVSYCPRRGGDLTTRRSGTRRMGTTAGPGGEIPELGIPTTSECDRCGRLWDRPWGSSGEWRPSRLEKRAA